MVPLATEAGPWPKLLAHMIVSSAVTAKNKLFFISSPYSLGQVAIAPGSSEVDGYIH
jgi:hypothetical protein